MEQEQIVEEEVVQEEQPEQIVKEEVKKERQPFNLETINKQIAEDMDKASKKFNEMLNFKL